MNLSDIETEWAKDSVMDDQCLSAEALEIPKLHHKYYKMLTREKMRYQKLQQQKEQLEHLLTQYFNNKLTQQEMDQYDLPPLDKMYLKQDIPRCVETHSEMVEIKQKMGIVIEKIELIKSILQQVHQRSFQIRDALEAKKFEAGY